MRRITIHMIALALVASVLVGCQSGPGWATRFAWWKHDPPPVDTSVVARSATPALPSSQVKPPQISPAAVPPSEANLVAAGEPTKAPSFTGTTAPPFTNTPAPPLPSSVPDAPVASYPTTTTPAAPASYPTTSSAVATAPVPTPPITTPTAMPAATPATPPTAAVAAQTGPYDPNAYRPAQSASAAAAAPSDNSVAGDDRYGGSYANTEPDRYSATASSDAESYTPPQDRYAEVPDRYASPAAQTAATPPATPAPSSVYGGDRYGVAASTPTAAPTAQYPTTPTTTAATPATPSAGSTVQIASPAGQYRPGGTSSYQIATPASDVEIASRPSSPEASTPQPPGTTSSPATVQPSPSPTTGGILGTY